jgi:hypothetical protein
MTDSWGWVILCGEGVCGILGFAACSQAFLDWHPLEANHAPSLVITTKNVSRYCQMFPVGQTILT